MFRQQLYRVIRKGPWTLDEERQLIMLVNQFGAIGNWSRIASILGSRNAYQCRKRYRHIMRANTVRRPFPSLPSNSIPSTPLTSHSSRLSINSLINPDRRMNINFIID